jgi:hypothetical protein
MKRLLLKEKYHLTPEIRLDVLKSANFFETSKHKCKMFGVIDKQPIKLIFENDGKSEICLCSKWMNLKEFYIKYSNGKNALCINGNQINEYNGDKTDISRYAKELDVVKFTNLQRVENFHSFQHESKGKLEAEYQKCYLESTKLQSKLTLSIKTKEEILKNLFKEILNQENAEATNINTN